jgi:hypothetical protein
LVDGSREAFCVPTILHGASVTPREIETGKESRTSQYLRVGPPVVQYHLLPLKLAKRRDKIHRRNRELPDPVVCPGSNRNDYCKQDTTLQPPLVEEVRSLKGNMLAEHFALLDR